MIAAPPRAAAKILLPTCNPKKVKPETPTSVAAVAPNPDAAAPTAPNPPIPITGYHIESVWIYC
jgi:hypothetical protein